MFKVKARVRNVFDNTRATDVELLTAALPTLFYPAPFSAG